MNDPASLADSLASRQDQKDKIQRKINNVAPTLASELQALKEIHSARREALLHAISRLDEELVQSEATLTQESSLLEAKLRGRLLELKKQDERDRKAISVATLPGDILASIFEQCVDADTGEPGGEGLGISPRILALVSRNWYRVAVGNASLWRTILITDSTSVYWQINRNSRLPTMTASKGERTHSAMQVCTTPMELERALKRTRGAALDITIAFRNRFSFDRSPVPLYSPFYVILFDDRVAPRITHLVLERWSTMDPPLFEYVTANVHRVSNLVSLAVIHPRSQQLTQEGKSVLQLLLENSKSLKCMFLADSSVEDCLRASRWQNASYSSTILNLQQLRLQYGQSLTGIFSDIMPIPELIIEDAARVAQAEERQMWEVSTHPWPNISTPKMCFTHLTRMHLILNDISLLSRLTFPVLEYLRLTQSSGSHDATTAADLGPLSIPNFVMDLPKLRNLRITARHFAPVNRFNLPQLQSFHMTSTHSTKGKAESDFSQLFSFSAASLEPLAEGSESKSTTAEPTGFGFQSIHTLYINANISEKSIIQALRLLPLLSVLKLVPGKKIAQVLIRELTLEKPRHPSKERDILCPALEIIDLDLVSFREWDRGLKMSCRVGTTVLGGLPNALIKCVASRRKAGKPLRRCTVVSESGQHEYVES